MFVFIFMRGGGGGRVASKIWIPGSSVQEDTVRRAFCTHTSRAPRSLKRHIYHLQTIWCLACFLFHFPEKLLLCSRLVFVSLPAGVLYTLSSCHFLLSFRLCLSISVPLLLGLLFTYPLIVAI